MEEFAHHCQRRSSRDSPYTLTYPWKREPIFIKFGFLYFPRIFTISADFQTAGFGAPIPLCVNPSQVSLKI